MKSFCVFLTYFKIFLKNSTKKKNKKNIKTKHELKLDEKQFLCRNSLKKQKKNK